MRDRSHLHDESIRTSLVAYVEENGAITNRQCRELLGIDYDQAIYLFNHMVENGHLVRIGKTSQTRYVLPSSVQSAD